MNRDHSFDTLPADGSGSKIQVDERSASVITQNLSPALEIGDAVRNFSADESDGNTHGADGKSLSSGWWVWRKSN
jgi:hypothetical protein